ncbi:TetR/AcrR family transcriptional regulator [Sphingomonas sp. CFBP 13720]|uniref:TetR/AcrR family transcriptional regulator n=1 Tax=Sphingomonas sp. CFBP 13720 TaxID=2775302 RepID=UPI0018D80472|nr:TetR/AcrR family transcriptional regulator [Sphingomonas sp. CFBP 13720]
MKDGTTDMQATTDRDDQPLAALAPRDRILKAASNLFYRHSIHTVGIDRIIAESGVAKMTFYKHFPSKARLVADYLRHQNVVWLQMLASATDRPDLSPEDRVLAIFDALGASFRQPPFRGCPFVKGLAEFGPDADLPEVEAMIAGYFDSLHALVAALVAPLAPDDPDKVVVQLLSLIQGAIVMAQTTSTVDIAAANRDAARRLLMPA